MNELVERTLAEASELVARREVSAVELTQAVLQQIAETEPVVSAFAHLFPDAALDEARTLDRELAHGRLRGVLHGVPIGVKDIVYMRGVPTDAGSRALTGFVPDYDATIVRKLRDAGAVIVGKTVTHEFAWGVNVPVTRSPWRDGWYPGGSSAGSGVAVSVRSAFGAIGTDTGGSIRIPAAVNGLVGLKPTFGRVSRHGIIPLSWSLDHPGALTRTVADNAILLQVLAGHDPADLGSIDEPLADYRAQLESGVDDSVIGVERDHYFYSGVIEDVRAAVEAVIDEYASLGARIVEVQLPAFAAMPSALLTILLAEASAFHRRLFRERALDYDPATRLLLELGELVPATHYVTGLRARTLLRDRVKNLFRAHGLDALISPTIPLPTVPNEQRNQPRDGGETAFTAYVHHTFPANLLGLPALSVPCGLTSDGLPIGFQLLGRPFAEATIFRLARAYERNHSWPALRPPVLQDLGS
ncbi:MAG TPA: amidase [Gaiellaceae bacterium]|nr:amidase [Gaiellaceae bacterium]